MASTSEIQRFIQDISRPEYLIAASLGLIPGVGVEVKFGHSPNTASGVITDVWERGDAQPVYIFPDVAGEVLEIVSDNVADTQEIMVEGLDAAGLAQRETANLTGITAVALPGVWTAVNRAFNSNGTEILGEVLVRGDGSTTTNIFASLIADDQQTSQAIYMVSSDKIAAINNFSTAVNASGGPDIESVFTLKVAHPGKIFRTQIRYGLQRTGTSNLSSDLLLPQVLGPGDRVKVTAVPSGGADVSAEFSMVLINKDLVPAEVLAAIIGG